MVYALNETWILKLVAAFNSSQKELVLATPFARFSNLTRLLVWIAQKRFENKTGSLRADGFLCFDRMGYLTPHRRIRASDCKANLQIGLCKTETAPLR